MRWSALVSMAVAAMTMVAGGEGVLLRTSLVNQGYDDVLVGISPLVPENQADEVIKGIKDAVKDTSEALFKATGNRLFFRKVKILAPSTWKNVKVDQPATNQVFEASHIRVEKRNPVYGDQVYTLQPGGCGDPGRYIHVTPAYLTHRRAENVWGPRGKVLVQAWARLRWGVFDEIGYPSDPQFPLFYHSQGVDNEVVVKPNYCSHVEIQGRYVNRLTKGDCKYVNGLPEVNCRFEPDQQQIAISSLMSFTNISSMEEFCDDKAGPRLHNYEAPTRQNQMCNRSVWDVVSSHQDFQNAVRLSDDHPVTPEVLVVQQQAATFALVLDYSTSMNGQKIKVLTNTAKRWLLYDVDDGSSVVIVKFSNSGNVAVPLTEIKNSTRQTLANAVTTNVGGSTCIGCGLLKAIDQMKGHSNKVIILITDGGENQAPNIADVMQNVVQSGTRVVTISYGKEAEQTLETLSQNTGGKAYIVPGNDDGSFMNDAFQGSLTYQPGQTIINTNIKLYEWEKVVSQTTITESFTVDDTVGRNLEFRLDSDVSISGQPYLTSPSGRRFTDVQFSSDLNLWIIKLTDVIAETGTWSWTMPFSGRKATLKVTVTAQAKDPQTLPIVTEAWMNTGADFVDASQQRVVVYARVTQGVNPVVGAKVRAYITSPSTTTPAIELNLLDNGQNADMQAGDGVYSRYFTQFVSTGRYAVKAQTWDEGSAYINNGFIASRRRRRSVTSNELVFNEYCCGSVVPFNPEAATPTGNFTRNVAAGSFNVLTMPQRGDSFPPSQVRDVTVIFKENLTLRWTAPGDDYDAGTVSGYEVYMSGNANLLHDGVSNTNATLLLDFDSSSNMTELLQEAGSEITLQLSLQESLNADTLYYLSLRGVDEAGNKGPMSRPTTFVSIITSGGVSAGGGLNPWTITLLSLLCLRGAF